MNFTLFIVWFLVYRRHIICVHKDFSIHTLFQVDFNIQYLLKYCAFSGYSCHIEKYCRSSLQVVAFLMRLPYSTS